MLISPRNIAVALLALTTAVTAHESVENPAVKTRMDTMSQIAANLKILGAMAKGTSTFDAYKARIAAAQISKHVALVPAQFEAEETDPKSEAKPEIWQNFNDFTQKASALEAVALDLSASIDEPDDLKPALATLGSACKACHSIYRE